jgi:hypothetical protein
VFLESSLTSLSCLKYTFLSRILVRKLLIFFSLKGKKKENFQIPLMSLYVIFCSISRMVFTDFDYSKTLTQDKVICPEALCKVLV